MWTSSFAADMTRTRIRVLATPDVSSARRIIAAARLVTELMDVALGYTILSLSKYFWERYRETVQETSACLPGEDQYPRIWDVQLSDWHTEEGLLP